MKIGIDFDDTLADTNAYLLREYNTRYNTTFTKQHIHCWDYAHCLNMESDEFWQWYHRVMSFATLSDIKPLVTDRTMIDDLAQKHDLYVISARDSRYHTYISRWVDKYFPNTFQDIFLTSGASKIDLVQQHSIDMLVDDAIHNIRDVHERNCLGVVFTQPHNEAEEHPLRAKSWFDVYHLIDKHLEE